ncbi:MAG: hypothetical protein RLZ98_509 [Pseudomonadota bacterium]|jgi:threonine/homoserine/homoserine lactone efflux protein
MEFLPNPLLLPVGVIIGILVAAPVGPVNVLCIQRTLERGMWSGFAAGLGAVLADGLIALAAAMGVGAITGTIARYRLTIETVGGAVLIATGIRLIGGNSRYTAIPVGETWAGMKDVIWDIPKTFLMTITNPAAVLGLIAIFGGVSTFVEVRSNVDAFVVVTAIMAGSICWWLFLATLVSRLRNRIGAVQIERINKIAGVLLLVFGVVLLGEVATVLLWRGGSPIAWPHTG